MKYSILAETFQKLSETSSRLEKTAILADFLKEIEASDLHETTLLLQGRVFPEWDERKIGIAGKLALRAVSLATGHSSQEVEAEFKKTGDIGDAVFNLTQDKKQQTLFSQSLSVKEVFSSLQKIASFEGNKSQETKLGELNKLLTSSSAIEAKFIIRTVLEDLRVGIASGTLRDSIQKAFFEEDHKAEIKRALDLTADPALVITHIKEGKSLSEFSLQYGAPCKVMLARKERTFAEAFARTGTPVRLEYKYDGFRLQMHKDGNEVHLFTRRLEDVTKQFPDIVKALQTQVKAKKCIIDGEAVGFDPQTGAYQPFQHISKRIKRKHNISQLVTDLPVEINVFDVIKIEEEEYLDTPMTQRLDALTPIIEEKERVIRLAKGIIVENEEQAQPFYQKALDEGNEGIMIKDLKGLYEPGGRVSAWIKMKPTMDDLDLVVVGAEWGSGKRSEWMTSFTLACRNEDDELVEVGKVGTGLKEIEDGESASFPKMTELLQPLIISEKGKEVRVKPEVVVTIAYEEIQKSPTYTSGYALRFPRVIALRPDRGIDDIATRDDIIDLFDSQ